MKFRKNSLLFYQSEIFYIFMVILCSILIPILGETMSILSMVPFIILILVNPKLYNEFITIDETGISCQKSGKQIWIYGWDSIEKLKRSSRFLLPSIEVIVYNKYRESKNFASSDQYFQLGKIARKAIKQYYKFQK